MAYLKKDTEKNRERGKGKKNYLMQLNYWILFLFLWKISNFIHNKKQYIHYEKELMV